MAVIPSSYNPASPEAAANRAAMAAKLAEVQAAMEIARAGGGRAGAAPA